MINIIKDKSRILFNKDITDNYKGDMYVNIIKDLYAVVKPINQEEISQIMKFAYDNDIKVIVRGGGTGAVGSQIPINGNELIVDVSLMDKIIGFDNETLTLTVEPGVTLGAVQEYVTSLGYFYPPDPGSKVSTIGGNVSTNAGGMRAVKYGTTRNYVRSLDVVLANGEKTTVGGLTIKDSTGYDLKDLFIGSEGTLGVITQIKLKVLPKPLYNRTTILAFSDVFKATKSVMEILKNGFMPTALELFEKDTIEYSENFLNEKFLSQKGNAYVLLTLDGNNIESIDDDIHLISKLVHKDTEEILILNEDEDEVHTWNLRDHILYALMNLTRFEMLDEVVPINKFADMISFTKELQEKYNIRITNFGHAGDGNIHTILMQGDLDNETWVTKKTALLNDLYDKVKELGGLPSAEHGIGYVKKSQFLRNVDPVKLQVMKLIKKALDDKNILNPGKIFD